MANLIAIAGNSGTGKSTSIATLNPKETFVINVAGKPLPFPGSKSVYKKGKMEDGGNYFTTSDPDKVCQTLAHINDNAPHIKNIVIDDAGYLMAFEFMGRSREKGFDKFGAIAEAGYKPLDCARGLREDLNVIFIYHAEEVNGVRKIKTSGKMIDNHITVEGLFTMVLFTETKAGDEGTEYLFQVNTDGSTTAKTPKGMFDTRTIPNDLNYFITKMNEYYE